MTTYRSLNLPLLGSEPEAPPPVQPLADTSVEQVHAALHALDSVLGSGRRILLEVGVWGSSKFLVPNGEPTASTDRVYPDATTPRVVARAKGVPLTPGYLVALELLALPSGPTQRETEGTEDPEFELDQLLGVVELEVTYHGVGDSVTVTADVEIAGDLLVEGAEPDDPWSKLQVREAVALPELIDAGDEAWSKWTGQGVMVDLVVRHRGSPRVIDCVVIERPLRSTIDVAGTWTAAMYTDDSGQPLDEYPSEFPIVRIEEDDPGHGAEAIVAAIRAAGRLAPILFSWSAPLEHVELADVVSYDGGTGDDEAPPNTVTGTDWTMLPLPVTATAPQLPAWLLGNFGLGAVHSGEVLDGRAGALPVWVCVYWRSPTEATTAQLELRVSEWSVVEIKTTSSDYEWTIAPAWVECGLGPHAGKIGRVYMRSSDVGSSLDIRDVVVVSRPYEP